MKKRLGYILLALLFMGPLFAKGASIEGKYIGSQCGDLCYMLFKTSKGTQYFYGYEEEFKHIQKGHTYLVTYKKMAPMVSDIKIPVEGIIKVQAVATIPKKRTSQSAHRPSWCSGARTYVEKHICSNPKLYALEAELLQSYRNAREGRSKSSVNTITKSQRKWIKKRKKACRAKGDSCIASYYRQRIGKLNAMVGSTAGTMGKKSGDKRGNALYRLKNMTYYVDRRGVRLRNGKYKNGEYDTVTFNEVLAKGDLNGDGRKDYVVLLLVNGGGSGIFSEIAVVMQKKNGFLALTRTISLGDRVRIRSSKIKNRKILISVTEHGRNDAACCPTKKVTHIYRISGKRILKLR